MPAVAIGTPVVTATVTHYTLLPARASPLLCAILLALHFSQPFAGAPGEFVKWAAAAFIVGGTLFPAKFRSRLAFLEPAAAALLNWPPLHPLFVRAGKALQALEL
tara:strand:- start:103 stop:417 length:315 start_codon:yes stop_codon:yes gene_type:complete